MKKYILLMLGVALFAAAPRFASAADKSEYRERFYGKITKIDLEKRSLLVHNKRKDMDERFSWNQETNFVFQKKPIQPDDLKLGQSLIVSYISQPEGKLAKRITVRAAPTVRKESRLNIE